MSSDEVSARKFEIQPTVGDHFAWLRTRLALERTLMSWVKSATGLIAFGFTIVQVLERLQKESPAIPVLDPNLPRNLGLALIAMGVVNLAVGMIQYRRFVGYMWHRDFKAIAGVSEKPHKTLLIPLALLVQIAGVVAFVTVLFRLS
jgi:putative membrane protein